MKILSINIGKAEPLKAKPEVSTGLYKRPVEGAINIGPLGLEGDTICNLKDHGGPDQAVYFYTEPDYDWWSRAFKYKLPPGTFGENLLIDDLESADVLIGDRFEIGGCRLEVTSPRIPCANFALRMTGPHFLKTFVEGGRPGFYCRVLREGIVTVGDQVSHIPYSGERLTIAEMFGDWYNKRLAETQIRKYLAVPVHHKSRAEMEEKLGKL